MSGNDAFTKLLLHFDEGAGATTFFDASASARTISTFGDAKGDTGRSQFGGCSLLLDGSGDYVTAPNHADFNPAADFTIDFWAYPTSNAGALCVLSKSDPSAGYGPYAFLCGTAFGGANWYYFSSSTGGAWDIASSQLIGTMTVNAWQHIAVARSGNTYYPFKNGTLGSTWVNSSTPWTGSTGGFQVGAYIGGPYYFPGSIDEVRYSNGVARWTSNFTPPSAAYSADASNIAPYNPWQQRAPLLAQRKPLGLGFSGWRRRTSGLFIPDGSFA